MKICSRSVYVRLIASISRLMLPGSGCSKPRFALLCRFCSPPFLLELWPAQPRKSFWIRAPEPPLDPTRDTLYNVSHFTSQFGLVLPGYRADDITGLSAGLWVLGPSGLVRAAVGWCGGDAAEQKLSLRQPLYPGDSPSLCIWAVAKLLSVKNKKRIIKTNVAGELVHAEVSACKEEKHQPGTRREHRKMGKGTSVNEYEERKQISLQAVLSAALCLLVVAFTNREVGLLNLSPAAQVAV